jgi:predicted esterase
MFPAGSKGESVEADARRCLTRGARRSARTRRVRRSLQRGERDPVVPLPGQAAASGHYNPAAVHCWYRLLTPMQHYMPR